MLRLGGFFLFGGFLGRGHRAIFGLAVDRGFWRPGHLQRANTVLQAAQQLAGAGAFCASRWIAALSAGSSQCCSSSHKEAELAYLTATVVNDCYY